MTATVTQQNLTNLLRYAGEILKISERVIAERFSLNSDQSEWLPPTRGTHSHQVLIRAQRDALLAGAPPSPRPRQAQPWSSTTRAGDRQPR